MRVGRRIMVECSDMRFYGEFLQFVNTNDERFR